MVVIVMGLPGSGKSYFATRLATAIHADYINSDRLRKTITGQRSYSAEEKKRVYDEMLLQMRPIIMQNKDLVLDATFYKNAFREKVTDEARKAGNVFIIEVVADELIIKQRVNQKRTDSEADFGVYKIVKAEWEPIREKHLVLQSTNDNIDAMLQKAMAYLHTEDHDKGTD